MWQSVKLSQKCSSSSVFLIVYRRLRRFVLNQFGVIGYRLFGFRYDISLERVIRDAGTNEENLSPVTLQLLRAITSCWNNDPNLSLSGRILLKEYYCEILQTRCRINQITEEVPEILDIPISKPLFIVGWPRVGSTFMHKLLSCDPSAKGPPLWQLVNPIPQNWREGVDPASSQIRDTQLAMDYFFDLEPQLYMLHEMNAKDADECCHLFEQSWVDRHSPITSDNMEKYLQTMLDLSVEQQVEFYEFYKKTLQVMMYLNKDQPASHHILKDATHYLFIEALLKVFPDASILMLHRKPAPVAKSCLSGIAFVARYYYQVKNIIYSNLAARTIKWMAISVERGNEARSNYEKQVADRGTFYDVQFEEFVKNPIDVVKKIYLFYGYEYSKEFEDNMKEFLSEYELFRKAKPAFHHAIEPFGMSETEINDFFADTFHPSGSIE